MTDYFKCLQLLGRDAEEVMDLDEFSARVTKLQGKGYEEGAANQEAAQQMIDKLRDERKGVEDQLRGKLGRKNKIPEMRKAIKEVTDPLAAKKKEAAKKRIKAKAEKAKAKKVEAKKVEAAQPQEQQEETLPDEKQKEQSKQTKGVKSEEKQAPKSTEAPLQQESTDADTAAYEQLGNAEKALVKKAVRKIREGEVLNKSEEAIIRRIAPDFDAFVAKVALLDQETLDAVDMYDDSVSEGAIPEAEEIWHGVDTRKGKTRAGVFETREAAQKRLDEDHSQRVNAKDSDWEIVETRGGFLIKETTKPERGDMMGPERMLTEEDVQRLSEYKSPKTGKKVSIGDKPELGTMLFYTESGSQVRINIPDLIRKVRSLRPEANRDLKEVERTAWDLAIGLEQLELHGLSTKKDEPSMELDARALSTKIGDLGDKFTGERKPVTVKDLWDDRDAKALYDGLSTGTKYRHAKIKLLKLRQEWRDAAKIKDPTKRYAKRAELKKQAHAQILKIRYLEQEAKKAAVMKDNKVFGLSPEEMPEQFQEFIEEDLYDLDLIDYQNDTQTETEKAEKELVEAMKEINAKGNEIDEQLTYSVKVPNDTPRIVVPGTKNVAGRGKSVRKKDVNLVAAMAKRFGMDFNFVVVDEEGAGSDIQWGNPEMLAIESEILSLQREAEALKRDGRFSYDHAMIYLELRTKLEDAHDRLLRARRRPYDKGLVKVDEGQVTIFVSKRAKGDQERVSIIGHELGHVMLQAMRNDWSTKQQEWMAKLYERDTGRQFNEQEFDEWFANQVMAYSIADPTTKKQMAQGLYKTLTEKAIAKLKDLWRFLRNRFQLNEDFKEFMDRTMAASPRYRYAVPTNGALPWTMPYKKESKEIYARALKTKAGQRGQHVVEETARVLKRIGEEYIGSVSNWFHAQRDIRGNKIPELLTLGYSFHQSPNANIEAQEKEMGVKLLPRDYKGNVIRESMEHSIQKAQGKPTKQLNAIIEKMQKGVKTREEFEEKSAKLYDEMRRGAPTSEEGKALRKLYDDMYTYLSEAIPELGHRKDYVPAVWDGDKVAENYEQLVKDLMNPKSWVDPEFAFKKEEEAEEAATRLMGDIHTAESQGIGAIQGAFGAMQKRQIDGMRPEVMAKYQNNDIIDVTRRYVHAGVKRAEFDRRFGRYEPRKDGQVWVSDSEFEKLRKGALSKMGERIRRKPGGPKEWIGVTQAQENRLNTNLRALRGHLGQNMPANVRHAMGWLMTVMNFLTLGFSTLASLPDMAGIAIRSHGDRKAAWKGFKEGIQATIDHYRGKQNEIWEMGEQLGILTDELHSAVIQEQHGMQFLSPTSQRINEKWFRLTLLHQFTLMTRAMGTASAKYFITSAARKAAKAGPDQQRNMRYLKDLGLAPGDVVVDADGSLMRSAKIDAAINTYVNQSVLRPTPAQRPAWGSDPRFMLFFHLKSFTYSFWETIVRGTYNEMKARKAEGMSIPAQAAPALVAALTLLPLAAAGLAIRDWIAYGEEGHPRRQDVSPEYMFELIQRTGLTGPALQMFIDMEEAEDRGKMAALGIMGPSVSRIFDAATQDKDLNFVLKNIPILSQTPRFREGIKDWIEE